MKGDAYACMFLQRKRMRIAESTKYPLSFGLGEFSCTLCDSNALEDHQIFFESIIWPEVMIVDQS